MNYSGFDRTRVSGFDRTGCPVLIAPRQHFWYRALRTEANTPFATALNYSTLCKAAITTISTTSFCMLNSDATNDFRSRLIASAP